MYDKIITMHPTDNDFKLAKILINHSLKLKPKEHLFINASDSASFPLVKATYMEALKMGAYPVVDSMLNLYLNRSTVAGFNYQFYKLANEWQMGYIPHELLEARVKWMDAYISIVSVDNTKELNQIDANKILQRNKLIRPYFDRIIDADRWVLTYYPTPAMAQEAGVSYDWLIDFYYKSCVVDYTKMEQDLMKIEKVVDAGKEVHIVGDKTDLKFSINGRLGKACYGERNIPDGEVFCAPIWETVDGHVYFEFPTLAFGTEVREVYVEFKKGRIVKAKASMNEDKLLKALDTDEGSRSLGELGIGANYNIKNAMNNTLFDEKIGGTIHLAIGRSYKEERGGAPKGYNDSVIHWDIVKDMRKKGSVLSIDGKPLLKEGKFLV